jgi:hypothetical protein
LKVREFSHRLAQQYRNDPKLFSILEQTVPDELRRLKESLSLIYDENGNRLNGANLLLTGYDGAQNKLRSVRWDFDLNSRDLMGRINVMGNETAMNYIFDNLPIFSGDPVELADQIKKVAQKAAESSPGRVGSTFYGHSVVPPGAKNGLEARIWNFKNRGERPQFEEVFGNSQAKPVQSGSRNQIQADLKEMLALMSKTTRM